MKGVFLNDNIEFSELIKLCGVTQGQWNLTLLEGGLFISGSTELLKPVPVVEATAEGSVLICDGRNHRITATRTGNNLAELVGMEPRTEALPETVYFLYEGKELPAEFIIKSFKLSCDRIHYASVQINSQSFVLLKVQQPSEFINQYCEEEWGIRSYILQRNLLVPSRLTHPLASILRIEQGWKIFINEKWHSLAVPEWLDVYSRLTLACEFEIDSQSVETSDPLNVTLPVTAVPCARNEPAEMWLCSADRFEEMERVIAQATEDELTNYSVCSLKRAGKSYFLIRSRQSNESSLEFPGEALSRFSGFANFMMPVDKTLNPPLRRDTFRKLFSLNASTSTLLVKEGEKWQLFRIDERSFEPLGNFVHFLVEAEQEKVETLRSKILFDPGMYLDAMPRPDLKIIKHEGVAPVVEQSEKVLEFTPVEEVTAEVEEVLEIKKVEENLPVEDDSREAEIEKEIINEGQSLESWKNLMLTKKANNKFSDALTCLFDALWLADKGQEQTLLAHLPTLLDSADPNRPLARAAGALIPGDNLDSWLSETIDILHGSENQLRTKELWLLWKSVLQVNRDSRHWVRLRENLRNSLVDHGLDLEDTPAFIRNRIFLERCRLDKNDPSSAIEFEHAAENLKSIYEIFIEKLPAGLKSSSQAILAASSVRNLGNIQTARRWLQIEILDVTEASGWFHLFADHSLRNADSDSAAEHRRQLEEILRSVRKAAAGSLNDMDDQLQARETENADTFLSASNLKRLYPVNEENATGEIAAVVTKIKAARALSETNWSQEILRQLESLKDIQEDASFARAVDIISGEVKSLKMTRNSAQLIDKFVSTLISLQPRAAKLNNSFYRALTLSNCALGAAGVQKWSQAAEFLKDATLSLKQCNYPIDFVDCAAVLLGAIEQMPLQNRKEPLKELAFRFCEMMTHHERMLNYGRLFPHVCRLIHHMSEAAAGREKISLSHFRDYMRNEEFLILHRLGQEEPV